jgi:hypothetical protein
MWDIGVEWAQAVTEGAGVYLLADTQVAVVWLFFWHGKGTGLRVVGSWVACEEEGACHR